MLPIASLDGEVLENVGDVRWVVRGGGELKYIARSKNMRTPPVRKKPPEGRVSHAAQWLS